MSEDLLSRFAPRADQPDKIGSISKMSFEKKSFEIEPSINHVIEIPRYQMTMTNAAKEWTVT